MCVFFVSRQQVRIIFTIKTMHFPTRRHVYTYRKLQTVHFHTLRFYPAALAETIVAFLNERRLVALGGGPPQERDLTQTEAGGERAVDTDDNCLETPGGEAAFSPGGTTIKKTTGELCHGAQHKNTQKPELLS